MMKLIYMFQVQVMEYIALVLMIIQFSVDYLSGHCDIFDEIYVTKNFLNYSCLTKFLIQDHQNFKLC